MFDEFYQCEKCENVYAINIISNIDTISYCPYCGEDYLREITQEEAEAIEYEIGNY